MKPFGLSIIRDTALGELYLVNQPRIGTTGYDWFVPRDALGTMAEKLQAAAEPINGRLCGWQALEMARVEAGIPRFSVDMDESNLPLEADLEGRAISSTKGCYIGQEIIARMESRQRLAKQLMGLRFEAEISLPATLLSDEHEVGVVTSVTHSPALGWIGLGYLKSAEATAGQLVQSRCGERRVAATVSALPFY